MVPSREGPLALLKGTQLLTSYSFARFHHLCTELKTVAVLQGTGRVTGRYVKATGVNGILGRIDTLYGHG